MLETDRSSLSQGFWYFAEKKQNFAEFSGANSRKNRPIFSRDFRGKKVKIRGKISRFVVFLQEKSQNSEKNRPISRGFKEKFQRIFRGKFLEKLADFTGNFGGKQKQEQPISLDFLGEISLKSINFVSISPALVNVFFNWDNHLLFQQQFAWEMSEC